MDLPKSADKISAQADCIIGKPSDKKKASPSKLRLLLELATNAGNRLENDEPNLVNPAFFKAGERDFSSISFWDVDGIPVVSKGETAVALNKESPRRASLPRGPGGDSILLSKESFSKKFPEAFERLAKASW